MKLLHVALAAYLVATVPAQGAVITDGSMGGAPTRLEGPAYQISSNYGKTIGSNLFHSFSTFNLTTAESATFTYVGPPSVRISNIISRVTGGAPSTINGTISSEISGATLYLVNPGGILFGPGAFVDVSGSFSATTADYLQIGPVQFDARGASVPENFHLAMVPPSAFGFLGANPAPIYVADSTLKASGAITFVGGDISIKRNGGRSDPLLSGTGGLNLVSVGSAGEAAISDSGMDISGFSRMGTLTVSRSESARVADIETSRGKIYISAGSFLVDRAHVASVTTDGGNSGDITISASDVEVKNGGSIETWAGEGKAGDVRINATRSISVTGTTSGVITESRGSIFLEAPRVALSDAGVIELNPNGDQTGGELRITTDTLALRHGIITNSGGNVTIDTGALTMSDRSNISALPRAGNGGDLLVEAKESVALSEESRIGSQGGGAGSITVQAANATLTLDHSYIYVGNWSGTDDAGTTVSAKEITIKNGGRIVSIAADTKAGDIDVTAERLTLTGNGNIWSNSRGSHDAGDIDISASNIVLEDGGRIYTSVGDPEVEKPTAPITGNGGSVDIQASDSVTISGAGSSIDVSTKEKGNAGTVTITTPILHLADQAEISSKARGEGKAEEMGNAGLITLNIGELLSIEGAQVTTDAAKTTGGSIGIHAPLAYVGNGSITTSVHGGRGDGGNIAVSGGALVLQNGDIAANAVEGDGGRISITDEIFLADRDSSVTASSQLGLPGTVDITAPLVDVSANLVMLPEQLLKRDDLEPRTCAVGDDSSSFTVKSPQLPDRPERNLLTF